MGTRKRAVVLPKNQVTIAPTLEGKTLRTVRITIRLTPAEHAQLLADSAIADVELARFIRRCALHGLELWRDRAARLGAEEALSAAWGEYTRAGFYSVAEQGAFCDGFRAGFAAAATQGTETMQGKGLKP